jgi:pilus assembly protein CpaC
MSFLELVFLGGVRMKNKMSLAFFIAFTVMFSIFAQAQETETPATDLPTGTYRTKQYINLTMGIEQDIKLPALPENVEFKGDFKKVTSASFAKDLNIIRFIPRSEGFATLTIHDKKSGRTVAEYRVDVQRSKLDKVVREVRSLLGDIEGISIKVVNSRVIVDGQVLLPKDLTRITSVVGQFSDQAASMVTMSPLAMRKIAEVIARDIANPEIEVRAIGDKIILDGFASSEDEKVKAEILAKTYLPDMFVDPNAEKAGIKSRKPANDGVINLIKVKEQAQGPPPKMIQLVVHFVELNKEYGKSFRFQFTPEISDGSGIQFSGGQSGSGSVANIISGTISNLLPKLNWAKNHGHARVLESTSLIVQDGKQGTIQQQTAFPVPTPAATPGGAPTYQSVKVGINSQITPVLLGERSGSVKMDMNFSVSSIVDFSSGIPITAENNIVTTLVVRDRQSAAVGGLIRNVASTAYNPPNGAKNPVISLYASKSFQRKQSQFVVFVTPVVKTSASAGSEQVKKKFRLHE